MAKSKSVKIASEQIEREVGSKSIALYNITVILKLTGKIMRGRNIGMESDRFSRALWKTRP